MPAHSPPNGHHHHHDQHQHHHQHHRPTLSRGFAAPAHHVGRRRFLADLGRGTFAIAVLGGISGLAACSGGDDDSNGDAETAAPPVVPSAVPSDDSSATSSAESGGDDLRWTQVSLGFVSAYVLVRGREAAVVDTGTSGSADQIGEALGVLGLNFDDVRHVVLTHSHGDHVGSLTDVLERSTAASVYAGELDIPNITSASAITGVGDGDDVFGLEVIATPGHTPGSISLFDPALGLLVAGDALTGNDDGTGLSGSNERFTADVAAADASVVKLAGFDVDSVAMGHGEPVQGGAASILRSLADSIG
ncbi:MAG: MBL fold metallo-hydrolase [Ilumatobacteraceae bacterium]